MSECYSFVVNGVPCSTEEEKPLLRYLRDELRLTSVKDGCSEGACGTCTILVDGKAVKACILSTKRAAGKEIVTVEGLSEAEREAFVYAFGAVGAVQCGFCIPGMVIAGKALLDQKPNPTEAEIKKAIRGNVCRCTGYKKIIEGIALAGAILRGEAKAGDPLPSIRSLAKALHISILTVQKAYDTLQEEGFIETTAGKGCYVAPQNQDFYLEEQQKKIEEKFAEAITIARASGISLEKLTDLLSLMYEEDE